MPDKFVSKIITPFGERLIKASATTDELMQEIKNEANNVFYATYIHNGPDSGNTSYEDIKTAYDAGKAIYVKYKENASDIGSAELLFALVAFIDHTGTSTPTTLNNFRFQTLEQSSGKTIFRFPSNWSGPFDHTFADSENLFSLKSAIAKDFFFLDFPVAEGTYCTYGYDLYKANQEVTTDTWSDSQWTKVKVMDELSKGDAYVDILQTPFANVLTLYNQSKCIIGRLGSEFYNMISKAHDGSGDIGSFSFQRISGPVVTTWHVVSDGPSETNNWGTPPSIHYNAPISGIATPYDETSTYIVGDIVSRGYGLYKCITAITTPESWTSAHWTMTSLIDGLANVAKSGDYVDLLNKPSLGTAAEKNVPVSGNAGNDEVVLGNDTRLNSKLNINVDAVNDAANPRCLRIQIAAGQNLRHSTITIFGAAGTDAFILNLTFEYVTGSGFAEAPKMTLVQCPHILSVTGNLLSKFKYEYDSTTGLGNIYLGWNQAKRLGILVNTFDNSKVSISTITPPSNLDSMSNGTYTYFNPIASWDGTATGVGSLTQPVYVDSYGQLTPCSFTVV